MSKNLKVSIKNRDGEFSQKFKLDKTLSGKNLSKKIYSDLLQDIYIEPDTIFSKWSKDIFENQMEKNKLFSAFANINHITISTKLRNFQYKLLHRVLALNPFLNKIGIVGDNKCTFCKLLDETITHLFYDCVFVKPI